MNIKSIANLIKKECIECDFRRLENSINRPSPFSRRLLNISPLALPKKLDASLALQILKSPR
jgi:hypothetical protein